MIKATAVELAGGAMPAGRTGPHHWPWRFGWREGRGREEEQCVGENSRAEQNKNMLPDVPLILGILRFTPDCPGHGWGEERADR